MKEKLNKIDDRQEFIEIYHRIGDAVTQFGLLSPNIPKPLLPINQFIHKQLNGSLCDVYMAANTFDGKKKLEYVYAAKIKIFSLYSSFEYLSRVRALTIGACNTVLDILYDVNTQIKKWYNFLLKE